MRSHFTALDLRTARTGANFSTAPVVGALLVLMLLSESVTPAFCVAGAPMTEGVWLQRTEQQVHDHESTRVYYADPNRTTKHRLKCMWNWRWENHHL